MKKTILLSLLLSISSVIFAQDKTYGEKFEAKKTIEIAELAKELNDKEEKEVVVTGTITNSCSKMGCWMTMKVPGQEDVRVTFKDYGFFVPKEGLNGKKTIVKATAKMQTTSVETLRHYAEDAGKSKEEIEKITEAKHEITLVASGVIIK